MRYKHLILTATLLAATACHSLNQSRSSNTDTTSSTTDRPAAGLDTVLKAGMKMKGNAVAGAPVELEFKVINQTDTALKFCKWFTPFEGFMSAFLEIKNEQGQQVDYIGAMAKRIMPPPASSYLTLKPKDSMTVVIDIRKGYNLDKSGRYTVKYAGGNMSGLVLKDSLVFVYQP